MGRGQNQKSFEVHARKILHCFGEIIVRNMNLKDNSSKDLEKKRRAIENTYVMIEYWQNKNRGGEEHVTGSWRKGNSCYKAGQDLVQLGSSVLWKVELFCDNFGYLAGEISKQSTGVWLGLSLLLTVKCEKEKIN